MRSLPRVAGAGAALLTLLVALDAAPPAAVAAGGSSQPASPYAAAVPVMPGETSASVIFDTSDLPPVPGVAPGAPAEPASVSPGGSASPTFAGPASATWNGGASLPAGEVLGFAETGEITSGSWAQDVNFNLLSTIAYAFVNVTASGTLVTDDSGYQGFWSSQMTSMINAAHAAGDRVVVSISDHGASCGTSCSNALLGSASARQTLVNSIISLIAARGIDGVNLDFEDGTDTAGFTSLVETLRSALQAQIPQSGYLTVDTFASAYQGGELWDLPALVPYVDGIDVMAYDLNYGNTLPNAPLNPNPAYAYTDAGIVQGYLTQIPASELILGVPYYGYVYSTTSAAFNAPRGGDNQMSAVPYAGVLADLACTAGSPDNLVQSWAPAAASPWAAWWSPPSGDPCGGNHDSYRELYYDNAQSLLDKYQLVAQDGLRGIGIWALGMDSGSHDLWNAIAQSFSVVHGPVARITPLPSTESVSTFPLCWTVQGSSTHSVVWARAGTGAWGELTDTTQTCATFSGHPGQSYGFFVQTFDGQGQSWGAPGTSAWATTTISASAAPPAPYASMYAVDGSGLLHALSSPPLSTTAYWPGWDIARGVALNSSGEGGYVLDAYGALHPFGDAPAVGSGVYWPGWDIARGVVLRSDGVSGYVLDAWGGVHAFGGAPQVQVTGYWPGWDIAVGIVLRADGQSGYVLDGWGGIHPFGVPGDMPPAVSPTGYWPGWDIARAIVLGGNGVSGYVLDGWGGVHPFGGAPSVSQTAYWPGWDIARGLTLLPGGGGYVIDGFGAAHPFGGAPNVVSSFYEGQDVIHGAALAS